MEVHSSEEHKQNAETTPHHSHETKSAADVEPRSDKFWKITTVVLIIILAIVAFKDNFNRDTITGGSAAELPAAPDAAEANVGIDDDYVYGKENAPVTIIEFSDYQCPYCGRFYQQTLPQIKKDYVEKGKVKMVFRDFPLSFHPEAEPAAIAANCAGEQGKYYEMHDKLFENQGSLSAANYKKWAQEIGLDVKKWESCLKDPKQRAEIVKDLNDGTVAGVQGTPAFFINGKLLSGAQPYSAFAQVIEAELR